MTSSNFTARVWIGLPPRQTCYMRYLPGDVYHACRPYRGSRGELVEGVVHLVLGAWEHVPVAVEHDRDGRVTGAVGDRSWRRAGCDPQGDSGVPEVVRSERGQAGTLDGGLHTLPGVPIPRSQLAGLPSGSPGTSQKSSRGGGPVPQNSAVIGGSG